MEYTREKARGIIYNTKLVIDGIKMSLEERLSKHKRRVNRPRAKSST